MMGNRSTSIMHKLESGRPHSAGPLTRRNATEQMKRIGETRRAIPNASRFQINIEIPAGGTKSASILNTVGQWLERTNVQHPAPVLKKASGKPLIIKVPLMGYQFQNETSSYFSSYIHQIKRHLQISYYQRLARDMDSPTNNRRFRLARRCRRPPLKDAEATFHLLRKAQQAQELTRSLINKTNPTFIKTLPKQMVTSPSKNRTNEQNILMTLKPPIKTQSLIKQREQSSRIYISPAQMECPPTKMYLNLKPKYSLIPKSKNSVFENRKLILITCDKNVEKFKKQFYTHLPPLAIPLPPTHKERYSDIIRQYENVIRNFKLPSQSDITASLYSSQNKIATGFDKTDEWVKEMGRKHRAVFCKTKPDLITVISHHGPAKDTYRPLVKKRPPIITVPVSVVDAPKEDEKAKGNKGKSGEKK